MFCHYRHADGMTKPPGQGHAPTPRATTKTPGYGRGEVLLLGKCQPTGVMLNPVGRRVRVKGFDAETFQTVPQLAGVLGGDDHAAGHDPYF